MGLWDLFVTASLPVLNVLLVSAVGSISATSRVAILGENARKQLNNVIFYVFNPALNAVNLAQTITLESMLLLWFMPVNLFLNFVIGSALAWAIIHVFQAPARIRAVIFACCSAGNVGNLLLILVPAMCKEKGSPFGDPDICSKFGLSFASLSLAIGTILQWSYVFNIVRVTSNHAQDKTPTTDSVSKVIFAQETISLLPEDHKDVMIPTRGCSTSAYPFNNGPLLPSKTEDSTNTTKVLLSSSKMSRFWRIFCGVIDLKKLFAPATVGVIIGFMIGVIPQLKTVMIGETAPLRAIQESATLLGNGTIPSLILIMGGNLVKGMNSSGVQVSIIVGIIIIRYLALPLVGIGIVKAAIHLGMVHPDPLYRFVLLLQYAVPPAMNITSMIQMFEAGEGELSVIFLWSYVVASAALTTWSTLFLWLVS
ncbi:putative membrane transport protein [Dioscorea sansibarensis]